MGNALVSSTSKEFCQHDSSKRFLPLFACNPMQVNHASSDSFHNLAQPINWHKWKLSYKFNFNPIMITGIETILFLAAHKLVLCQFILLPHPKPCQRLKSWFSLV